jgi:hypothetical protein
MLSGDYYVKSYERGSMTYFVYQLVNTSYQIENHYFENRFQILPKFIHSKISFSNTDNGTELVNKEDKVLAYYQFTDQPKLKEPYRYIWHLPFVVLLIIGLCLAFGKRREATPDEKSKSRAIEIGMAIIILVSIIGTYIYYRISESRENEQMERQAQNLLEKRDEAFESSYARFSEQIKADTNIREMLFAESNVLAEVILGYSKDLLYDETMQTYITTLTLCAPEEEITIQPEGYDTNCDDYFLEKLANNKQKRVGDGLYFMDYYTLDPNYLGKIKIVSKDSLQQKNLYFEFYKPIAPEGFGFPQLLKESNSQKPYDYSVANYRDNLLVYKYGRYVYPNFMNSLKLKDHDFTLSRHFKHYAIIDNNYNAIVISTPTKAFSEITAPLPYSFWD